jgi:mono/diheme cytochrome c family protein
MACTRWSIKTGRNIWITLGLALLTACDMQDMYQQPKYTPLESSESFNDGRSARPLEPDTVAQGQLRTNALFYAGKSDGKDATTLPMPLTVQLLKRGEERYDIYCAPCHDRIGNGNGMIVQRGFRPPASFHIQRLRDAPIGHFYNVMSKGFGAMADFSSQITPEDRWAIAAYIRALQLSQHATLAEAPLEQRQKLEAQAP